MCTISMVHDYYRPFFPQTPYDWQNPPSGTDWGKIIEDYRKAMEAAKVVDEKTGQPDCVDPEKAKLEARVAELEKRIDALSPRAKEFRVGALVKWTSQAAGRSKEKLGTIEAIVPAGKRPELKGCGFQRNHESYVVRVTERWPNGNVRSTRLYWPHVRNLEMA